MTNDITAILYRIKENIRVIEAGGADDSLLDNVCADFLELMELIKLFLISERDSYYGYFLLNMQFRANVGINSIAGIKLGEFPPVLEANPLLLCKFTLKEIIYVVCHEIDHVVLNHPAEMLKANPDRNEQGMYEFNLAADASVNERINHEIKTEKRRFLSAPKGAITASSLKSMYGLPFLLNLESYAYYLNYIAQAKRSDDEADADGNGQDSIMQKQNQKDGTGSGQGGKQEEQGASDSEEGETSDQGGRQIVTAANCQKLTDHNWEAGADAEDAAAAVRELVNASTDMMSEESRGLMPGYFWSQVEELNKPPVLSWQAILKKYIGTLAADKRKTRTRLNRRQPERFDLSGRMDDKVLKIVVAIDTSASVDDQMISEIFNEIFAILAKRKHEITVIECDAEVQRVYRATTPASIEKKVAGRGGTMFTPAIEYINNDRYFRDALLIYFTDGFGETRIPRPNTYRNLWVVFDDVRHLSLEEPYGAVVKL